MPTLEEAQKILAGKAQPPREAPEWDGPRLDPNYDADGMWTGEKPNYDLPLDHNKIKAREPGRLPEDLSGVDVDAALKLANAESVLNASSRTFSQSSAPQTPAEWETWKSEFTARVDSLGYIVNYDNAAGAIHIFNQNASLPLYIHKHPEMAVSWLVKEEAERAKARHAAEEKAKAMAQAAAAVANPVNNPANYPETLTTILARLDEFAVRLDKMESK